MEKGEINNGPSLRRLIVAYVGSRIYFSFLFAYFSSFFTTDYSGRTGVKRGDYWTVATTSDGKWYGQIAVLGYPKTLTHYFLQGQLRVDKSEWAFYPLWPMICRALIFITKEPFYLVGPLASLVVGVGVVLALHRMFLVWNVNGQIRFWITFWLFFSPVGAIISLAYTESLAILLLLLIFICVQRNRFFPAACLIVALSFTRPVTLALVFTFILYGIWCKKQSRPIGPALFLTCVSGVSFGLWPLILALKFHRWDAYFYVQSAWRQFYDSPYIIWFFTRATAHPFPALIAGAFTTCIILVALQKRLPPLLRCWIIGYLIFLLITVPADSDGIVKIKYMVPFYPSVIRYCLLFLFPPLVFISSKRWALAARTLFIGLCVLGTPAYIYLFLVAQQPVNFFWP